MGGPCSSVMYNYTCSVGILLDNDKNPKTMLPIRDYRFGITDLGLQNCFFVLLMRAALDSRPKGWNPLMMVILLVLKQTWTCCSYEWMQITENIYFNWQVNALCPSLTLLLKSVDLNLHNHIQGVLDLSLGLKPTYSVFQCVLGGNTVDLLYGVRGHIQTRRLTVVVHEQLVVLLIGWSTTTQKVRCDYKKN